MYVYSAIKILKSEQLTAWDGGGEEKAIKKLFTKEMVF